MTARYAVTDEHRLAYLARTHELEQRFLKGVVNPDNTLKGIQALTEGRLTIPAVHIAGNDPLSDYKEIRNLTFVGPEQWGKATTSRDQKNRNPLGLRPDWCPQPVLPYIAEQMRELARFCWVQKDWQTRVIFYLALPKVDETFTSLIGQYQLWGIPHDDLGPGQIRNDVFYSNWYVNPNYPNHDWASSLPVSEPIYSIGYEHPMWTIDKSYPDQQKVAIDRNMTIVKAVQDTLMLNVVLASTGERLRETTWSRTCTINGDPLDVGSGSYGVRVFRDSVPESAHVFIGLSVQGVPLELGF